MPLRQSAQPGEELKDVLVTLDARVWPEYRRLMRKRGTSASARLRKFILLELARARRNGEI